MFKKYPSIDNSYRQKTIEMFLKYHPELEYERFVVQEKYDGTNIQLIFNPNGDFKIASRNQIVEPNENFYDVWNIIGRDEYKELINTGKSVAKQWNGIVHIYGELYGKGIQKRINYGDDKYYRIFDIAITIEDKTILLSPAYLINTGMFSKYLVEIHGYYNSLQEAIDYIPENWDNIEGIVIKPFYKTCCSPQGSIFYLKKKSPAFEEKESKPKKEKIQKFSDSVESIHAEFGRYINENRVLSVFSKMGEIQDDKQIGEYIKAVIEDAKEEFLNDENNIDNLDMKEIKYVYNHSKTIVKILRKYL